MKGKTITITLDAMSMRASPRLIPQKIAEFAQRWGIPDATCTVDEQKRTVVFKCTDDTGNPTAGKRCIQGLMLLHGWTKK